MKPRSVGALLSASCLPRQWGHQALCSFHAISAFRDHLQAKVNLKSEVKQNIKIFAPVCLSANRVVDALLISSIVNRQHKD